jgi:uncharacterized protein YbjT (DUF2867 family)
VEDMVRGAGFARYTILKPAFMMENFTPPKAQYSFPDLAADLLVTALLPDTKMHFVAADDIGLAALAAVKDPARFHRAEIELGGDARTMGEAAAILSAATGRKITALSLPPAEVIARGQIPEGVNHQEWANIAGYPATPADAHPFGLHPMDLITWARLHAKDIARLT